MSDRPPLVGLTGPIGCGKSTVGRMLAELGGYVIDADRLARDATAPGEPTLPLIRERFGDAVFNPDGSLDRAGMAALAFSDPDALADLERIIHPAVRKIITAKVASVTTDDVPFVVVEAIKLVESGLADRCTQVWLVDCAQATQIERMLRRGLERADAERRLQTQGEDLVRRLSEALDEKGVRYRRVSTDGSIDETRERVEDALAELLTPLA